MSIKQKLVRDIVNERLGAGEVFRRHGIDFYRIGSLTLWQAAARQGIDADLLIDVLSSLPLNTDQAPVTMRHLIKYMERRYFDAHQHPIFLAVRLAWRVEHDHASHDACPHGLAALLKTLGAFLDEHQRREAEDIFPAMLRSPASHLRFPVLRMMNEHDDISDQLATIAKLTRGFMPPLNAPPPWRELYEICGRLDSELLFHMHLENNVLFPRFLACQKTAA